MDKGQHAIAVFQSPQNSEILSIPTRSFILNIFTILAPMKTGLLLLSLGLSLIAHAQSPVYTKKHFVTKPDNEEFKPAERIREGIIKDYVRKEVEIYDVDDNDTATVKTIATVLIYVEGEVKNYKMNGIARVYVIDSLDHKKRYLIGEQTYEDNKLNGLWKIYNLKGTYIAFKNCKNDGLSGLTREYELDGKTILKEADFLDGSKKALLRNFKKGKLSMEVMYVNGVPNGVAKNYYETGVVEELYNMKDGKQDGFRTYYYPNRKPWLESVFKDGKFWEVVANYDSKGNKRNAGTLKDGNGTIILYDDDTTIRETVTYKNGVQKK